MGQVVIGVDPHKRSNTALVLDDRERVLGRQRFANDRNGYRERAVWTSRKDASDLHVTVRARLAHHRLSCSFSQMLLTLNYFRCQQWCDASDGRGLSVSNATVASTSGQLARPQPRLIGGLRCPMWSSWPSAGLGPRRSRSARRASLLCSARLVDRCGGAPTLDRPVDVLPPVMDPTWLVVRGCGRAGCGHHGRGAAGSP